MIERELSYSRDGHSVDAVQRAAYRLSDRISCQVEPGGDAIAVTVTVLDDEADADALIAELRTEVLDQVLRERIRAETGDVRNLVLAMAFSRTGLADADV
jgi:His-Xaa-Ser system protein HxsD